MASRVLTESALRVSDCVTGLLRKQPFFGSLVLRLPLRPDPNRETLATDGHEIRYSPRWVAETASRLIETAMARVVMACALKHHTRRGDRDPERWQMASQLVSHALLRDAGFTLPPDAEAWDGLAVASRTTASGFRKAIPPTTKTPWPLARARGLPRPASQRGPQMTMATPPATRPTPPMTTTVRTQTPTVTKLNAPNSLINLDHF